MFAKSVEIFGESWIRNNKKISNILSTRKNTKGIEFASRYTSWEIINL